MNSRVIRKITDKAAQLVITVAGVTVIAAMLAMLALIVAEAAPLFMPASHREVGAAALPPGLDADDVLAVGVDSDLLERARTAGVILRDGRYGIVTLSGRDAGGFSLERLPGAPGKVGIHAVEPHGNGLYSLLWKDGAVALYMLKTDFTTNSEGVTTDNAAFVPMFTDKLDIAGGLPRFALLRGDAKDHRMVAVYADGLVTEKRLRPGKGLMARNKGATSERSLRIERGGGIVSAALNDNGHLYLGTDAGSIVSVDLSRDKPVVDVTPAFRDRRRVTALSFLNGGYALAVGDDRGGVSVWFPRREEGEFRFRRSVDWAERGAPVTAVAASGRDRGFLTLDSGGSVRWLYSTNARELADIPAAHPRTVALAVNARTDAMATLDDGGILRFHRLDGSHPEAGWAGFFRRLLYEGYEQAALVWQSTGSDAGEPKLSLVPLIWGSVKAAVYALLFATPIALAAAVYLSQFAQPAWRTRLKPAVEMLAAVPSVVIGFLAALWLAPLLERHLAFVARHWQYDQRNSLVIAIAMGFAVIPTVFSLAEDALTAVPPSLSAASLALGASKWQTVCRVVLPTASPGIFTAVMLGFGRAVGETMIVLMAAGNTPIISLSPFNGMRTLSANIAVEMPEAPVGGTLYRTLFLCALILFVLTLVINTAAEVFRHRLRRRYGRI